MAKATDQTKGLSDCCKKVTIRDYVTKVKRKKWPGTSSEFEFPVGDHSKALISTNSGIPELVETCRGFLIPLEIVCDAHSGYLTICIVSLGEGHF